jgi:flagellar biosynthesis protein FlhF
MKMKMFQGATVEEAMALVRAEFGPDAVILSERDEDGRVEIRAAVERSFGPQAGKPAGGKGGAPRPLRPHNERLFPERPANESSFLADQQRDFIINALKWQGATDGFIQIVADAGVRLAAGSESNAALSAGLEGIVQFNPIHPAPEKSLLLVGPHGSGKTTAAAKLALQFGRGEKPLEACSADFDARAESQRLAALMLKPTVTVSLGPDALGRLVAERDADERRLVIDGPSFNAIDAADMKRCTDLISRLNVEPVLVISAEGHPDDLADATRAFALAGCRRVIITRLDAVRRRGGVIAAISSARLSIAQLGLTSSVRSGLVPASSERIARLLLADAPAEAELLKGAA